MAAMAGQEVEMFPVVIPYPGIFLRDHWEEVTEIPWWAVRDGNIKANLQVQQDLQTALGLDWVPAGVGASRQYRQTHKATVRGRQVLLTNTETGIEKALSKPPVGGEQQVVTESSVHAVADIEACVNITSAKEMLESGALDYAAAVVEEFGGTHFVLASIGAPFWGTYRYFGFTEMMTNLVERPELVELLLDRLTLHHLEYLKAYAAVGIDAVWIEDCYSSAELISLNQFRRFASPYVKRLIDAAHDLGMKSIYYFCGDVSDRLADLVTMEPTCLSLEESKKGFLIDIAGIDRAACGKVCLLGNVDAIGVLQNGTREQMATEIERQLAVGRKNGRFVLSLGSPVTPQTPTTRVRDFIELSRQLMIRR